MRVPHSPRFAVAVKRHYSRNARVASNILLERNVLRASRLLGIVFGSQSEPSRSLTCRDIRQTVCAQYGFNGRRSKHGTLRALAMSLPPLGQWNGNIEDHRSSHSLCRGSYSAVQPPWPCDLYALTPKYVVGSIIRRVQLPCGSPRTRINRCSLRHIICKQTLTAVPR